MEPDGTAANIVVTIDVEWACAEVIADVVRLLDERNLRATFFCTHPAIPLGNHEKALHPNFRREANSHLAGATQFRTDAELQDEVLCVVRTMYPEAIGVRSHSLFFDSNLLKVYERFDLQYDSSCFLPLATHLQPVALSSKIVELPIYYMDEWDLRNHATQFDIDSLRLETPGLKILDFHPTLIFVNAPTHDHYIATKPQYRDPDWLRKHRHPGRGVRSLFLEVLDHLAARPEPSPTLADIHARWRGVR